MIVIIASVFKREESPCRGLIPYQQVRVHLYAIRAIPRGLSGSRNSWTRSEKSCVPAITVEERNRPIAAGLSGLYPYPISRHVSISVRNGFIGRRLRPSQIPRTFGPQGREDNHDLYPCFESWRKRCLKPHGFALRGGALRGSYTETI
jgi:hypothetical protein